MVEELIYGVRREHYDGESESCLEKMVCEDHTWYANKRFWCPSAISLAQLLDHLSGCI